MPKPEISTVLLPILVMYEAVFPDQVAQGGTLTAPDSLSSGTARKRPHIME
jgi:hypothetical protein